MQHTQEFWAKPARPRRTKAGQRVWAMWYTRRVYRGELASTPVLTDVRCEQGMVKWTARVRLYPPAIEI